MKAAVGTRKCSGRSGGESSDKDSKRQGFETTTFLECNCWKRCGCKRWATEAVHHCCSRSTSWCPLCWWQSSFRLRSPLLCTVVEPTTVDALLQEVTRLCTTLRRSTICRCQSGSGKNLGVHVGKVTVSVPLNDIALLKLTSAAGGNCNSLYILVFL